MLDPSETDTVVKRILPYLRRREYDPETDLDFEAATKHPERYTKGYIDLLIHVAGQSLNS